MNNRNIITRATARTLTTCLLLAWIVPNFTVAATPRGVQADPAAVAQLAPANDDLANAQLLAGLNGTAAGNTTGATKEPAEPAHAKNRGGASVWFKYVAAGNSVLTVNTSGSTFDTTLAVYKGTAINNLKLIAENDDSPPTNTSSVTLATQTGDVFYVGVDGYYNSNTGSTALGSVQLNYSVVNVDSNDNFANAKLLQFSAGRFLTTSNVGASKESGEPSIGANSGGKSIWYKWIAPVGGPKAVTFTIESMNTAGTGPVKTMAAIFTGVQVNALTEVISSTRQGVMEIPFQPNAGVTYYLTIDGFDGGAGAETGTFTVSFGPSKDYKGADFDRDGHADLTVFRPSTGTWYTLDSITDQVRSVQFGANGDKPLLMDMGRDGKLDYTIFRPDTGVWYVLDSESGFKAFPWGSSGDIPVIEHLTLFNSNSLIAFRPATGMWWSYSYLYGGGYGYPWGTTGDIPMMEDFVGSGWDQNVVFRPSNGTWYVINRGMPQTPVKFGTTGDKPVPADYDGDGLDDYAVYRPSTGVWYIQNSSNNAVSGIQWGISTDVPQPADYDGDGRADLAVFRSGVWYIRQSATGTLRVVQFGSPGDVPVTAPIH